MFAFFVFVIIRFRLASGSRPLQTKNQVLVSLLGAEHLWNGYTTSRRPSMGLSATLMALSASIGLLDLSFFH